MILKKAQVQPAIVIAFLILLFIIINQSTKVKYQEVDLSLYEDCSAINLVIEENTIVGWTNSGRNHNVYYATFTQQNDIIEIKEGVVYKVKYPSKGYVHYRCGTTQQDLREGTITVKSWW